MTATLGTALAAAGRALAAAGVATPRLDARILLEHAAGLSRETLAGHPDRRLGDREAAFYQALVARRRRRQPVAQLVGRREFWSLDFMVTADVLTPRPDSETLVETALAAIADRAAPLAIVDLGTGSGCLLLALLSELPRARGIGVDISAAALGVAAANARRLGLADRARFVAGDWGRALAGEHDLVVANPPYVDDAALAGLAPEARLHEPRLALAGGVDGLACYRRMLPDAMRLLAPRGTLVVEVGAGQAAGVAAMVARTRGFRVWTRPDLAGIDRCVAASRVGHGYRRGSR